MISVSSLVWDTNTRILRAGDDIIELSPREFAVLEILLRKLGSLVTKKEMAALLSDWDEPATYNAIDIVIHRLRKKLEPFGFKLRTIRGLGFIVEPEAESLN
jgi:two-component system, OmpR family, response regulator